MSSQTKNYLIIILTILLVGVSVSTITLTLRNQKKIGSTPTTISTNQNNNINDSGNNSESVLSIQNLIRNTEAEVDNGFLTLHGIKQPDQQSQLTVYAVNGSDPVYGVQQTELADKTWDIRIPINLFRNGPNTITWELRSPYDGKEPKHDSQTLNLAIPETYLLRVAWQTKHDDLSSATIAEKLHITSNEGKKAIEQYMEYADPRSYVVVGTVTEGEFKNSLVLQAQIRCEMTCNYVTALLDESKHRLVLLGRHADWIDPNDSLLKLPEVQTSYTLFIPELEAPSTITLAGTNSVLTLGSSPFGESRDDLSPIGKTTDGRIVYNKPKLNNGCFYIILPNGEVEAYRLKIEFYSDSRTPTITWNGNILNTEDYQPFLTGGCGATGCLALRQDSEVKNRITPAGKTSTGDTVFLFKDSEEQELKDLYTNWYIYSGNKPDYQSFIASRPIFFWKDPLGRWVMWTRTALQNPGECGKPVVYLYPEKPTQVSVKLGKNIDVTTSEPEYNNGWMVTANPSGVLIDGNGTEHPYLFWEGNGASYTTPKHGWVVASKNIDSFLSNKLAALGLNQKEAADFKEFWTPKLAASPYAFISFVPQETWNNAAPLQITPKPKTVIRVFMDWHPLSSPVSVEPQTLPPTPDRSGFTAVEWGGLLYKTDK